MESNNKTLGNNFEKEMAEILSKKRLVGNIINT